MNIQGILHEGDISAYYLASWNERLDPTGNEYLAPTNYVNAQMKCLVNRCCPVFPASRLTWEHERSSCDSHPVAVVFSSPGCYRKETVTGRPRPKDRGTATSSQHGRREPIRQCLLAARRSTATAGPKHPHRFRKKALYRPGLQGGGATIVA